MNFYSTEITDLILISYTYYLLYFYIILIVGFVPSKLQIHRKSSYLQYSEDSVHLAQLTTQANDD